MLVVADTSALIALAACDGLRLLETLFKDVRVPTAVFQECTTSGKPEAERLERFLSGRVSEVDLTELVIAATGLGQGELEAMVLYKRLHADRLLADDRRARKVARLNSMVVIGSVGVLLLAKAEGLVPAVRSQLDVIRAAGVYLDEQLIAEALRVANE
jgi:uncharacterized protein